ncbi:lactosylceramide 4-alpha-galactosyltransferase isoform X1 [Protopterus annectens]|uniref:lactosylceramide 4-alpha-galactosyltransferase isoform X1 n=1 Tax=Protopterus annectens TaxID=7888 RepID=UPI001CF964FB|nr:lactosylceramide 4-alpha-galactosyltransferase isoform X1 [Protopterus annectens]XP_043943471.1 lactosylceramide 4-alpha-galactosyltransferase isoform X1 [Protopterus annectens]XP_043943472.1 lactosylceramide 4-alpha-galactosyltransferase isoform X1 [Protopterus annectens]XP_043943473.1 lactosylceramide 4-alpha-galactosyltransferase isoform X1 [Protopterus annectens]XP_043943474.1 lactosylceramide 4-alpha-galactosyltransferase isoform X1 [Protopterus annectens]XP_043943475.1 lactosylceramid
MIKVAIFSLELVITKHRLWGLLILALKLFTCIMIILYCRNMKSMTDVLHYSLPQEVECSMFIPNHSHHSLNVPQHHIFFLETSDRLSPNFLCMCSVESAARAHPEFKITIYMKGLAQKSAILPKNLGLSFLSCFHNVEIQPLDVDELFKGTPLAEWYAELYTRWEPYRFPILSDACRIAMMWKHGGIYLDTDFIVLRDLGNLTNTLGTQSKYVLNGAYLSFHRRHKFIELCMKDFVENYNRFIWGHQGPQLMTRIFKKWCRIRSLRETNNCRGVSVLPQEAFYPIRWQDWKKYFEAISPSDFTEMLKNTYAVHIWNKKSQGTKMDVATNSLLNKLYSNYCPSTYKIMKTYL